MSPAAAFVVAGALVLAVSGDLPFGTLASPGAGMLPKLVVGLMMAFGAVLLAARRRQPAVRRHRLGRLPARRCASSPSPRPARRSTLALGFLVTMALLLFGLTFVVERRPILSRGRVQRRRDAARLRPVRHAAQIAAPARRSSGSEARASGSHPRQPGSRFLGRLPARRAALRLPRLPGRHAGRHAAGHRPAGRHLHPAARDLRPRRHQGHRHAGRHLLRLAVRRLHHLDPDAHPGRGVLRHDLHRRLRHGAEGPRRRGAVRSPRSARSSPAPSA